MKRKMQPSTRLLLLSAILLSSFVLWTCSPYTEGEPIQEGLPTKYAIIIIDMQKDFILPTGKLPVDQSQSQNAVRNINSLLSSVNTKTVEVLYIGNEFSPSDSIGNWFRNSAAISGQPGATLVSNLAVVNDIYFAKEKPDAFSNTEFDQYLREKKATHLVLTGVFADQCVMSTIKGALQRGYKVSAIPEAVAAKNDKKHEKAIQKYRSLGVKILSTDDTINQLNS